MSGPAERLPVPDWDRPGETWRVEAEPGFYPTNDGVCMHRGCYRVSAIARDNKPFALCAVHTRESLMWIENGQVVSWSLRP